LSAYQAAKIVLAVFAEASQRTPEPDEG